MKTLSSIVRRLAMYSFILLLPTTSFASRASTLANGARVEYGQRELSPATLDGKIDCTVNKPVAGGQMEIEIGAVADATGKLMACGRIDQFAFSLTSGQGFVAMNVFRFAKETGSLSKDCREFRWDGSLAPEAESLYRPLGAVESDLFYGPTLEKIKAINDPRLKYQTALKSDFRDTSNPSDENVLEVFCMKKF